MGVSTEWFAGPIQRSRVGVMYRIGLSVVAVAMVLLPLLYLLLVLAAAAGTLALAYHLLSLQSATVKMRTFVPLVILAIGGTIVFFLFKPLFARRDRSEDGSIELDPATHPRLFAFVADLCSVVDSPRPSRIKVMCEPNASASLRRGLRSIPGQDLELRIGLTLILALDLPAMAGILAHEFGHFSQRTGMGLTYTIRAVNAWFHRVVYERDHWDESLHLWSSGEAGLRMRLVAGLARIGVTIARTIVRVLMLIGHGISCFALRQMEYDADRTETLVVGSEQFRQTTQALPVLNQAFAQAFGATQELWDAGDLIVDLPGLAHLAVTRFSEEDRVAIHEACLAARTRLFDTHPGSGDRIRAADALDAPGVFRGEGAARDLFPDLETLCRNATEAEYRYRIGPRHTDARRITLDEFRSRESEERDAYDALTRFFGPELSAYARVFPEWNREALTLPTDEVRERIRTAVNASAFALREAERSRPEFDSALESLCDLREAAGREFVEQELDLPGTERRNLPELIAEAEARLDRARASLVGFYKPMLQRLSLAIAVLHRRDFPIEDRTTVGPLSRRIEATLTALADTPPAVDRLLVQFLRARGIAAVARENRGDDEALAELRIAVDGLIKPLRALEDCLLGRPMPFTTRDDSLDSLIGPIHRHSSDDDAMRVVAASIEGINDVYFRCMAHLCKITLQVEEAVLR